MATHEKKAEIRELQYKSNQITDETLESTRRMMVMCEESKEAAIQTLVNLDEQGEQIEALEQGMDRINEDMKEAEKNLSGMAKCCGLFNLPWQKVNQLKEDVTAWKEKREKENGGSFIMTQSNRVGDRNGFVGPTSYIARITRDAREDEMDENMGQVNVMVGNLRDMAVDMGSELDSQNKQLNGIAQKTELNAMRIKMANEKAGFLLKKA